jgi:hypothetical protein
VPTNPLLENDSVVAALQFALDSGNTGLATTPALVKRVIEEDRWRERTVKVTHQTVTFTRFEEFVTEPPPDGLGGTVQLLENLCRDDFDALRLLKDVTTNPHGGDRRSESFKSDNVTLESTANERGNERSYALRKLSKSRPDLHAQVIAGDLSPHAAMVEAGFRKKTVTIPVERLERYKQALWRITDLDPIGTAGSIERALADAQQWAREALGEVM